MGSSTSIRQYVRIGESVSIFDTFFVGSDSSDAHFCLGWSWNDKDAGLEGWRWEERWNLHETYARVSSNKEVVREAAAAQLQGSEQLDWIERERAHALRNIADHETVIATQGMYGFMDTRP